MLRNCSISGSKSSKDTDETYSKVSFNHNWFTIDVRYIFTADQATLQFFISISHSTNISINAVQKRKQESTYLRSKATSKPRPISLYVTTRASWSRWFARERAASVTVAEFQRRSGVVASDPALARDEQAQDALFLGGQSFPRLSSGARNGLDAAHSRIPTSRSSYQLRPSRVRNCKLDSSDLLRASNTET